MNLGVMMGLQMGDKATGGSANLRRVVRHGNLPLVLPHSAMLPKRSVGTARTHRSRANVDSASVGSKAAVLLRRAINRC